MCVDLAGSASYCVDVQPRTRRILGPGLVGAGLIVATLYIGAVDPNTPGHYFACPLKSLTGLDCPGCGGLRAVHSLVHGDIGGALNHNLLAVLMYLPAIAIGWFLWMRREWDEPTSNGSGAAVTADEQARTRKMWLAAFIVIAVFTVARNIHAVPVFDWLGSAA